MKQIYVPEFQAIYDVYGTVCDCNNELYFVIWNKLVEKPRFDAISVRDCVPYDGEMLPNVKDERVESLKKPGMFYDPEWCDECADRFDCYPTLFTRALDEIKKKVEASEVEFKKQLDMVAKSRERVFDLKKTMERAAPGTRVTSIGLNNEGDQVQVNVRIEDPELFYGPEGDLGKTIREKIKADAERRAAEGTRIGMGNAENASEKP